jgi:predicted nucleic acid-binding Zn ribbon protein
MREKRKHPVHAGELVAKTARRFKLHEKMMMYKLWERWAEIAGAAIIEHARPERWQRGTLVIMVENSAWMQELSFLKDQMIERVRAIFPETKITGVRFELGALPPMPHVISQKVKEAKTRKLSTDEEEFVEQSTFEIADPSVRSAAKRAMLKGLGRVS